LSVIRITVNPTEVDEGVFWWIETLSLKKGDQVKATCELPMGLTVKQIDQLNPYITQMEREMSIIAPETGQFQLGGSLEIRIVDDHESPDPLTHI